VKVNFPFYPIISKGVAYSAWYCCQLKLYFDDKSGTLKIMINEKPRHDVYIPPLSPYASTEAIDIEDLRNLCSEDSNAVMVHHYTRVFNNIKSIYIIVVMEKDAKSSSLALKLSSQSADMLLIGVQEQLAKMIEEFKNRVRAEKGFGESSEVIEIRIEGKYAQRFRGIPSKMSVKIVDLSHVQTYPQILTWPFHAALITDGSPQSIPSPAKSRVFSIDAIDVLLGSIVVERKPWGSSYVFAFLPTPLLSSYYHLLHQLRRSQGHGGAINPLLLPSINLYDAGSLAVEVYLHSIANSLFESVAYSLRRACELLKEINAKLHYSIDTSRIRNIAVAEDQELDPKALLKALMSSFLFAGITISVSGAIDREVARRYSSELRSFIRRQHPHRVSPLEVALNAESTVLNQLRLVGSSHSFIRVWRSYVDIKRSDFLEKLLDKLIYIKSFGQGKKYSTTQQLLAAYLLLINDFVQEFKNSNPLPRGAVVSIDVVTLTEKIVTLLIEYGLHGVSHTLLREAAERLKIRKQRLNEVTVLIVPQAPSSVVVPANLFNAFLFMNVYMNIVLDGYHYRVRGGGEELLRGLIMVTDTKPYTSPQWRKALADFDVKSFARGVLDQLHRRNCYRYWEERRNRIAPAIDIADAVIEQKLGNSLQVSKLLSKMVDFMVKLFDLDKADKQQALSLPLSEFRRLLVPIITKAVAGSSATSSAEEISKLLHREIKHYLNAIYEYAVPFCFDGCHNCIMIDRGCGLRNPLLKEWTASRHIAARILESIA
jgi:hypothetical protein